MKKIVLILSLIFLGCSLLFGQATPQTDKQKEEQRKNEAAFNSRVDNLRNVGKEKYIRDRYKDRKIFEDKIQPIYRKPTKQELELVEPMPADAEKFEEFLKQKDTGLVRLITDRGCDKGVDIVVSTPHCGKYSMPGAGSSYSFREARYRNKQFADVSFSSNKFYTNGLLIQSIFVDIGDVSLDGLNKTSRGISFLKEFEPAIDLEKVVAFNLELEKGIEKDGLTYRLAAPLYDKTTYLVRSVAYRGEAYRVVDGVTYNELELDNRKDVIVAFRVVSYQSGEGVTILWKLIDEQKAPKIELPDGK